jgi:hypothetical protein
MDSGSTRFEESRIYPMTRLNTMFTSYGNPQLLRFASEGSGSTIPLHCLCGAVFWRNGSLAGGAAHAPSPESSDSDDPTTVSPSPSKGSVDAVCPSCGASRAYELSGYPRE